MPSRHELTLRAYAMGFDPATIANDSKLEQKVLFLEKNQTKVAITGTAPTTTLTSTGTFANNDTLTFTFPDGNTRVYTMKTTLTTPQVANEILIGVAATNSLDNIKSAINGTGTPGTDYSSPTTASQHLTAGAKNATTLVIASSDTNTNGSVGTTISAANFAWTGATMSAGTLGAVVITSTFTRDVRAGISGDRNVSI